MIFIREKLFFVHKGQLEKNIFQKSQVLPNQLVVDKLGKFHILLNHSF